ncbi:MAG: DUF1549 domain-containing protein [Isosphaeraceae bacterium]
MKPSASSRHEVARRGRSYLPGPGRLDLPDIDGRIARRRRRASQPNPTIDDASFLRRPSPPPTAEEVAASGRPAPDKRERMIDARLADARWADSRMGYWQDVLAENPGILKPTLNNTGPFRRFLYQAMADDLPYDRWVTEAAKQGLRRPRRFGIHPERRADGRQGPRAGQGVPRRHEVPGATTRRPTRSSRPSRSFLAGLLDGKRLRRSRPSAR